MSKKLCIMFSPSDDVVYVGNLGKRGLIGKTDITEDACFAVAEYIGLGFAQTFVSKETGVPFEIVVRAPASDVSGEGGR